MKSFYGLTVLVLLAPGCTLLPGQSERPQTAVASPADSAEAPPVLQADAPPPPTDARTAEEFDTTSEEERAAAVTEAATTTAERSLGTTIASLGAVGEPGIWLKTPLVSAPAKGRVEFPEKGTSVALDLIPLDGDPGSGSRISLAAMRLLEADLTSLPELKVFQLAE